MNNIDWHLLMSEWHMEMGNRYQALLCRGWSEWAFIEWLKHIKECAVHMLHVTREAPRVGGYQ